MRFTWIAIAVFTVLLLLGSTWHACKRQPAMQEIGIGALQ